MKPAAFKYVAPDTVDEVLAHLGEHGDDAAVLAGGQSLMAMMNLRLARPAVVIDIRRVPGLADWREIDGAVAIGAMSRQRRLETDAGLARSLPLMAEAVCHVGHPPTRHCGTIVGSLCHADPAAELPLCALVADAVLTLRSTRGTRTVAAGEFFQGVFTTAVGDDELVTEARVPIARGGTGTGFVEVSRRYGDFALVAVGCALELDEGRAIRSLRLALAGVDEKPVCPAAVAAGAIGQVASADVFRALGESIAASLEPHSDLQASAAYRRSLAGTLSERALTLAAERAGMAEN